MGSQGAGAASLLLFPQIVPRIPPPSHPLAGEARSCLNLGPHRGVPVSHGPVWRCPTCLETAPPERSLPSWGRAGRPRPSLAPVGRPGPRQPARGDWERGHLELFATRRERLGWRIAAFDGEIRAGQRGRAACAAGMQLLQQRRLGATRSGCASAKPCQHRCRSPGRPQPNVCRERAGPPAPPPSPAPAPAPAPAPRRAGTAGMG